MWTYFTDTDCDVTPQDASKYGFKLISMPYSIETQTVYPYEDFDVFDSETFYNMLRSGVIPTTSAVSKEKYLEYFEPEFAAGRDIFYVHFSEAMSMTFGNMRQALAELAVKYPERRFLEVDTKGITIVSYLIFTEIAEMLQAGKTPDDIVVWAEAEVRNYAQYFFADDLKFFRRSGRVNGIAATMGGLIGIRPVIHMSADGKMESIGTEKGRVKTMESLLSHVIELGSDLQNHKIIIGHTDAPEFAAEFEAMLRERISANLDIVTVLTNPTAGSHCGPNGMGVAFHSKGR